MARSPRLVLSLVSIAGTIAAIAYCGWFLYYFFDVGGSWQGAVDIGLGPTVVGLGAIAFIFVLVLLFKLSRLFRTPGPDDTASPRPPSSTDDADGFDADAVISRYLARNGDQGGGADPREGPALRQASAPSFGRRNSAS